MTSVNSHSLTLASWLLVENCVIPAVMPYPCLLQADSGCRVIQNCLLRTGQCGRLAMGDQVQNACRRAKLWILVAHRKKTNSCDGRRALTAAFLRKCTALRMRAWPTRDRLPLSSESYVAMWKSMPKHRQAFPDQPQYGHQDCSSGTQRLQWQHCRWLLWHKGSRLNHSPNCQTP